MEENEKREIELIAQIKSSTDIVNKCLAELDGIHSSMKVEEEPKEEPKTEDEPKEEERQEDGPKNEKEAKDIDEAEEASEDEKKYRY